MKGNDTLVFWCVTYEGTTVIASGVPKGRSEAISARIRWLRPDSVGFAMTEGLKRVAPVPNSMVHR